MLGSPFEALVGLQGERPAVFVGLQGERRPVAARDSYGWQPLSDARLDIHVDHVQELRWLALSVFSALHESTSQ